MLFQLVASALLATAAAQDLITALQSQPDLSILLQTVQSLPDIAEALASATNITILAPIDSAFEELLHEPLNAENFALNNQDPNGTSLLLQYHVLQGAFPASSIPTIPTYVHTLFTDELTYTGNARTNVTGGQNVGVVNNGSAVQCLSGDLQVSTVIEADVLVGDVVVHKIDRVLSFPNNITTTGAEIGGTTAVAAINAAGLNETLDLAPDLTLFVPTNEAFDAIGSILAGASLDTVTEILQYHAVTGSVVFSGDVTNTSVPSVQGNDLTLSVVDGSVFVNSAKVVIPNIILSNGVAHVIDAVLNPEDGDFDRGSINPEASPEPAFSGASSSSVVLPDVVATTTVSIPAVLTTGPVVATAAEGESVASSAAGSAAPTTYEGGASTGADGAEMMLAAGVALLAVAFAQ